MLLSRRVDLPPCIDSTSLVKYVSIFYKVDQLHQSQRKEGKRKNWRSWEAYHWKSRCFPSEDSAAFFIKPNYQMENTPLWFQIQVLSNNSSFCLISFMAVSSAAELISSGQRTCFWVIFTRLIFTFGLLLKKRFILENQNQFILLLNVSEVSLSHTTKI